MMDDTAGAPLQPFRFLMENIIRKMLVDTPAELECIGIVVDLVECFQCRFRIFPFQGTNSFTDIIKIILGSLLREKHLI